ncbi:MAG: hypothetical protein KC506_01370, partial [Nanoarchaeota archaeon]|nr:hypothetical protein [Nanoarchaeota archaeon]
MKKSVAILVLVLFLSSVSALSSTIQETYTPRETIIASLSDDIISTIKENQINLLRDGHIDVGFEFGIKKINGKHHLWLIAPQNIGNYTLRIEDVVASVNGIPEVVDFEQNFEVAGEEVDYSIKPGIVSTGQNFQITLTLYEDFSQTVQTDFPETREVMILPGANIINYDVSEIFGNQMIDVSLGDYVFPVYVTRPENICGDGIISGEEVCDGDEFLAESCNEINSDYVSGNLSCESDCLSYNEEMCENEDGETIVYVCGENHL